MRRAIVAAVVAAAVSSIGVVAASAVTSGGWSSLGNGGAPNIAALNGRVSVIVPVGPKLYIGGLFTNAGGIPAADYAAIWDGTHWSAIGAGLNGAVTAIAVNGSTVFVGGSFDNAGGDAQADSLAKWNGTHWTSVSATSFSGPVYALQIVGSRMFIGGGFDNAAGFDDADAIVAYDLVGHSWSPITDSDEAIVGTISALAVSDGGLYVGSTGATNMAGIPEADFLARYDLSGGGWSAVGPPGPTVSAIKDRVRGLAVSGSDVYVVGDFIDADGIETADKIVKWDGGAWSALGSDGAGGGFFGEAQALSLYSVAIDDNLLFVGGGFLNAGGQGRVDAIAGFTQGDWTNVGTNAAGNNGPGSGIVLALATSRNKLYAGTTDTAFGGSAMNADAASFKLHQPDLRIAVGQGQPVGNNVYNATGSHQTKTSQTARGSTVTFRLTLSNDGFTLDDIVLKGPGSGGGFTVQYVSSGQDVTAHVIAGTLHFLSQPENDGTLQLKVTVGTHVQVGTSRTWLVTATCDGVTPVSKDAVKAKVTAK